MARAFSMIELVIVVVIIGIIAAIAIPRFEGMTDNARGRRLIADLDTLQKAAELYTVEHGGVNLGKTATGSTVSDLVLRRRLLLHSDEDGTPNDPTGLFGPYVRDIPTNVYNEKATIRVDGAPAGAGTHGWRFDTATGNFAADTAVQVTLPDGSVVDNEGVISKVGGVVSKLID